MQQSSSTLDTHRLARGWTLSNLALEERDGDDRLYDQNGRSYKVKARRNTGRATSFDIRHGSPPFDFLVGVLTNPDGEHVDGAFIVNRAVFDQLVHHNQDAVRFRLSKEGPDRDEVEWIF